MVLVILCRSLAIQLNAPTVIGILRITHVQQVAWKSHPDFGNLFRLHSTAQITFATFVTRGRGFAFVSQSCVEKNSLLFGFILKINEYTRVLDSNSAAFIWLSLSLRHKWASFSDFNQFFYPSLPPTLSLVVRTLVKVGMAGIACDPTNLIKRGMRGCQNGAPPQGWN